MRLYNTLLVVLAAWMLTGCSTLLFHPDQRQYASPDEYNLMYEQVTFISKDGTPLSGWWIAPQGEGKGTVMIVHGNAQNISAHFTGFVWLAKAGYELFIFDYRGFGDSGGDPDLGGAVSDTKAALAYVLAHRHGRITAIGQSLGGALLMNALVGGHDERIRLAVFDSTYASLPQEGSEVLARSVLTWPFQWSAYVVLSDAYDPIDIVSKLTVPKLFIAGSKDTVTSPNHSWQLFDAAARPRQFWLVPETGHITAFASSVIQRRFLDFLAAPAFDAEASKMLIFDTISASKSKND